jgi:hypothetical protein
MSVMHPRSLKVPPSDRAGEPYSIPVWPYCWSRGTGLDSSSTPLAVVVQPSNGPYTLRCDA